ncbi:PE-PPE domain-containing protein [Gordonia hankookensis]|uniref:PE-PPE domain-containing protein n=1 Tax=Gordonia hankookensis TaxID=589403 RepID=A0ABR7WFR7_9ACTN|nr:PE-PPE domain-containing protein [Gordonia hankookensis]MBD1321624.1 PE-PPE domain-containing protein [Gordonia hankookensis]
MGGFSEIGSRQHRRVTVLAVGGTGESFDGDRRRAVTGMLRGVTEGLDDRFDCRWIGYPASYGPAPHIGGISYQRSLDIGMREVGSALRQTEGPVALIGYSQGAVVIRAALHELGEASDPVLERVLAVGFVADPHQPPGVVAGCEGWGVAGPGPALPATVPAHWVGTPDDMICNATADSFLRDVADLTAGFAVGRVRSWMMQMWNILRHNSFQNADRTSPGLAQMSHDVGRLWSAGREVLGYLPGTIAWRGLVFRNRRGGRHTSYAREPYRRESWTDPDTTGCEALAAWLQVCATFSDVGCAAEWGEVEFAA